MCCDERLELFWLKKIARELVKEAAIEDLVEIVRVEIREDKP